MQQIISGARCFPAGTRSNVGRIALRELTARTLALALDANGQQLLGAYASGDGMS